jgi:predicted  nucleic acid-binding Zn-ribbon protein
MKMTRTIAAVVVTGALFAGVGATSAFAAPSPGAGRARVAALGKRFDCSKAAEVKATLDDTKVKLGQINQERTALLEEWKATAADAGLTKVAARVDKRIAKLAERGPKIGAKIDKLEQKIDQKCSPAQ